MSDTLSATKATKYNYFDGVNDNDIRIIYQNDTPWLIARDVCAVLKYANSLDAIVKHVDSEDKTDGVAIRDSIGRVQKPVLINESGFYSRTLSGKLSSARSPSAGAPLLSP